MIAKAARMGCLTGALFLCSLTIAAAQPLHRHHAQHASAHHGRAYAAKPALLPAIAPPYQAYAGPRGPYYGDVPHDPLIPLRHEIPPAVDPNEPGSGSYGAMLEGRNPAPGEP